MDQLGRIAALCLLFGSCVGCDDRSAPPVELRSARTRGNHYLLTYIPTPDPIRVAQPFSMQVAVTDTTGNNAPIRDASLAVDGWMPAHQHGMYTKPAVTPNGDGTYTVEGMLFHMEMLWQIRVDVTRAGETERAIFNFTCCEQ